MYYAGNTYEELNQSKTADEVNKNSNTLPKSYKTYNFFSNFVAIRMCFKM